MLLFVPTGIKQRISYFNYLGVDAVWINPFYESPMMDTGYDVSNFTKVDPVYGTNEEFYQLIHLLQANGKIIYIYCDFTL